MCCMKWNMVCTFYRYIRCKAHMDNIFSQMLNFRCLLLVNLNVPLNSRIELR